VRCSNQVEKNGSQIASLVRSLNSHASSNFLHNLTTYRHALPSLPMIQLAPVVVSSSALPPAGPLEVMKTRLQAQQAIPGQQGYQGVLGTSMDSPFPVHHPDCLQTFSKPSYDRTEFEDCIVVWVPRSWPISPMGQSTLLSTMASRLTLENLHSVTVPNQGT